VMTSQITKTNLPLLEEELQFKNQIKLTKYYYIV